MATDIRIGSPMARQYNRTSTSAKVAPEIKLGQQERVQNRPPKMKEYNPPAGALRAAGGLLGSAGRSVNKVYKTY